jgi:hypothetical protein
MFRMSYEKIIHYMSLSVFVDWLVDCLVWQEAEFNQQREERQVGRKRQGAFYYRSSKVGLDMNVRSSSVQREERGEKREERERINLSHTQSS